jgi:hypothetical protein
MVDYSDNYLHRATVEKVYGAPSDQHPQNAMTMAQVANRLSEFLNPESLLVEWSMSFCDYSRIHKGLQKLGKASILPPIANVFRPNFAWRFALTGFDVSLRLSVLYRMIGRYSTVLPDLAHRAEPDVLMMYELVVTYFQGTLQPAQRTQITHYLMYTCNKDCTKHFHHSQRASSFLDDLGNTDKEVPNSGDEDEQVDEDINIDTDLDEEGAQFTGEVCRMIMNQEQEEPNDDDDDELSELDSDQFEGMEP